MSEKSAGPARSAQRVIEGLTAQGVRYIFGIPGAKIDEVYNVLDDQGPQLVVCRHEQNAAFMAAAVGRLTRTPGVVLVTSGPGTANLATGLVTANTEGDPIVALCDAVPLSDRLKRTHQSMNAASLLEPVTKFTAEITDPETVPEAVANAFRAAVTQPRGAAALIPGCGTPTPHAPSSTSTRFPRRLTTTTSPPWNCAVTCLPPCTPSPGCSAASPCPASSPPRSRPGERRSGRSMTPLPAAPTARPA
jgi:hypothetical protein